MAKLSNIFSTRYWKVTNISSGPAGTQGVQGIQGVSGVDGGGAPILTNTQSGTYTLTSSDLGKIVCGVSTVIIPQNIFSTGAQISIASTDNNRVKIKPGSGITLNQHGVGIRTELKINQKSYCSILCVGSNTFVANGNFVGIVSATGGTITTPGNGYTYHTFTSPGTFTVTDGSDQVEVLIVAGGGGGGDGGGATGGGGGAGGVRYFSSIPVSSSPGSYLITVGSGGAAAPSYLTKGSRGGDSSAFGYTSSGGGHSNYGPYPTSPTTIDGYILSPGGSGAGPSSFNPGAGVGNTPPVSPPQGNPGGPAGGGGAGQAGQPSAGGNGIQFPEFTGPLIGVPSLGPLNGYFGGGGGSGLGSPSAVSGGLGGGGTGASRYAPGSSLGTAGVQNSGGGGGGTSTSGSAPANNGGSGIVVIRYQT